MKYLFLLLFLLPFLAKSQNIYFPPINNNILWDTLSPQSLGWCHNRIDSLYDYLEAENSKAFIVLKDGKIVLEKYFGTFTADSVWYWASAGKTLTSFLVGKANEDGILKLSDSSSRFLGSGWTNETPEQEGKITIRNQITMTTGLDDGVPDNHCTLDTCLRYLADAGSRWAYHNAPYSMLEKVLETASGQTINAYAAQKLKLQTGISGLWYTADYDNVFYSKARSMARFGILIQNKCKWNNTVLLSDTAYIRQMTNTSQLFNKSYGYLWWLNGKSSFMVPSLRVVFPGPLAADAPADMFAALGKNGQIISIAPSLGIVFVRMGNSSSSNEVPFMFCNEIWKKLNAAMCQTTEVKTFESSTPSVSFYPNPVSSELIIASKGLTGLFVTDVTGREVYAQAISRMEEKATIQTRSWPAGLYILRCFTGSRLAVYKFRKE